MTDNEFNEFIEKSIELLVNAKNEGKDISTILHTTIQTFVPCDIFHLLLVNNKKKVAINDSDSLTYPLDQSGILSQCYESHQALFINDIERSLLFNEKVDSLNEKSIAKVLIIPILSDSEKKEVMGMLWIGVGKGFQQFIKADIDKLVQFATATKHEIFTSHSSSNGEFDALALCQESKRALQSKIDRDEHYFASTIHEIRTPMNAVIGFMELLMLNEKDEQKKEYIDATLKSSDLIVSIINDALDMSKVTNGKMTLNKTTFSPLDGLSDIVKFFYNAIKKKNINFTTYIDPLLPAVINSDLHRIKQIVNNLLSNAIKFTPVDGKIILEAIYDKEKDILRIGVIDTGIGVDKEKQKSIFKPYEQEKDSTAKEFGGTGLGLAISQQLSILLNGTLTVESEKGEGSEFIFTFPCETPLETKTEINPDDFKDLSVLICSPSSLHHPLESIQQYFDNFNISYKHLDSNKVLEIDDENNVLIIEREKAIESPIEVQQFLNNKGHVIIIESGFTLEECRFEGSFKLLHNPILPKVLFNTLHTFIYPESEAKFADTETQNYNNLKDRTVLVIDDSMINLKLMVEILKRLQLDVRTSLNAKEGLELLDNNGFDIIFIDQNMPMMNGDEAIVKIREIEKAKNYTPAIIYGLTGDAHHDIKDRIIDAGADDVFTKPVHLEEVYNAISKAIESK